MIPRTIRRQLAYLLVGLADWVDPKATIAGLSNPELDAHLARQRRLRKQKR